MVECKAHSQNSKVERGEWGALKDRWVKLQKGIKQARISMEFIQQRRADRDVNVPADVTRFDYVVCTSAVEWIPSRDPELWLTDTIPRICTPAELVKLMRSREGEGNVRTGFGSGP